MNRSPVLIRRSPLLSSGCGLLIAAGIAWGQSPEEELATLRVLDGFSINLFASEAEGVIKPTQARFDGDGRLWVTTTTSYPQIRPGQKPDDKIVVLEDTDGDGRADRSTVFADKLHMPLGLELGDGGVYVGAADELLFLKDTDGDGKADERRVVFSGFGTGDTHQTINSFTWGPSGELMLSQGLHAVSHIETPWGNETLHQAGVWRFWPKRMRLDPFWDGAMGSHNPFGTVFDRRGQPFIFAGNGHGVYHLTQAMIRAKHFELQPSIWNQGGKFGGADIAENSHWPSTNRGEFYAGGYLQNTIERFRITPAGATFKAERLSPLVESTNTSFRVVDVRFGPDGALYLCDWFNPVIGHYQASFRHPDRDKTHGRIWRVTANNRATVARPPKLEHAPVADLLGRLRSQERWERQLAARVLRDRPTAETTNAVKAWFDASPNPQEREERLFEAVGIFAAHESPAPDLLVELARSTQPEFRAYAARVTGHWATRMPAPLDLLATLTSDEHPLVRLEAIVACSYVADAKAVEVAARAADRPLEPALRYAFIQCVHTLKPLWQAPFSEGKITFGGKAARMEAFTQADRSADTVQAAVDRLRRLFEVALAADNQWALVATILDAARAVDIPLLLSPRTFTVGANYDAPRHAAALLQLENNAQRRGVKPAANVDDALKKLLASAEPGLREGAAALVGAWRIQSLEPELIRVLESEQSDAASKASAIRGLAGFGNPTNTARILLAAGKDSPAVVQVSAVDAVAGTSMGDAARIAASVLARGQSEEIAIAAVEPLARQKDGLAALAQAMEKAAPDSQSARHTLAFLARAGRHQEALGRILNASAGANMSDKAAFTELANPGPALDAFLKEVRDNGRPGRGGELFQRTDLGCTSCHAIGAREPGLGPDFAALGTAQTPEFILRAILDPQREVKEGFMSWTITLKNGDEFQGRLVRSSAEDVVLFDAATRKEMRIAQSEIASRNQLGSIMPAGLAETLSRTDLRDLIRYLTGLGRK